MFVHRCGRKAGIWAWLQVEAWQTGRICGREDREGGSISTMRRQTTTRAKTSRDTPADRTLPAGRIFAGGAIFSESRLTARSQEGAKEMGAGAARSRYLTPIAGTPPESARKTAQLGPPRHAQLRCHGIQTPEELRRVPQMVPWKIFDLP